MIKKLAIKLNYLWRVIATGFCFSVFGLGGILFSVTLFPAQKLIYRDATKRKQVARNTVKHLFFIFIRLMSFVRIFKFTIQDTEALSQLKGQLILANHLTLIDVVVLISVIPNTDCVVKAHLFKNPFMRGVIKNTGYISNDDPESLLRDCEESLVQGNNLIIFPEGTRTKPGYALKFQRGAANVALRCQAKITSVLISVSPTTLTKFESWYQVPETRAHFELKLTKKNIEVPKLEIGKEAKQARSFTRELLTFFVEELKST